ncbi:VanZ family protein [Listeria monocytogenes]|nr:VanZ family protein [Listeria monocytogenes]
MFICICLWCNQVYNFSPYVKCFLDRRYKNICNRPLYEFNSFNSISEMFIAERESAAFQIVANIIMFVPLGMLLPLCYPKLRWKSVFAISFIATVGIELAQLLQDLIYQSPFKFVDIDDVILNFSGGIIGYMIFVMFRPLLRKMGLYPNV